MVEDKEQYKKSIRFFNDREVRAVWDEEHSKWWFSVLDIIAAINEQDDYQKTRNYWKYLKTKLRKGNSQLVSATNQLKLQNCILKSKKDIYWYSEYKAFYKNVPFYSLYKYFILYLQTIIHINEEV